MRSTLDVGCGARGERLRVRVEGEGRALLYLHGLSSLASTARREAPRGMRLATYDQRGHGDGPAFTTPDHYTIDAYVGDALAALDALAEAEPAAGWDRPAVGGTSMGSAVALMLALRHPERVGALALAGPAFSDVANPISLTLPLAAERIEQIGLRDALPQMRAVQLELGVPPDALWQFDRWIEHDERVFPTVLRTVSSWVPFPDFAAFDLLDVPVTIVAWPSDPVHPIELAERIAIRTGAPMAVLPGVGRVLAEPEAVARAFDVVRRGWVAA